MAFAKINAMKKNLTLDSAGRIVLPQAVRHRFHLNRGSVLSLEVNPDAIILRPCTCDPTLSDNGGLLVHEGRPVDDLLNAVELVRQRRDQDNAGL